MRFATSAIALLFVSGVSHADQAADRAALLVKVMETTKVIAVMDVEGSSINYKDDGDPNTLEVVLLSKRSNGPSRVSPDGEVVFLYKASDKKQSELIGKAFDLRVDRILSGS